MAPFAPSCLLLLAFLLLPSFILHTRAASEPHTIRLKHPRLYPEGFDWDRRNGHFILGSISTGALVTVSDAGVTEDLILDKDYAGEASVLGLSVDLPGNRVLAVVHSFKLSAPPFDALAAYDLVSKKRIFLARLDDAGTPDGERARANDVCVDYKGNAYVTNSAGNFVWKVDSEGKASIFARSPLFSSQPIIVKDGPAAKWGLNGIVYVRSGLLLVGQSNSGMLFKVDLYDAAVRVVHLNKPLPAIDGIAIRRDGALVAVSTHTTWLLRSNDNWMSAQIVDELPLDSSLNTTAVAFREGERPYVLHSHFQEALEGPGDRESFTIHEVIFPSDRDDPIWLIVVIVLFVVFVCAWRFQLNYFFKLYTKKRN